MKKIMFYLLLLTQWPFVSIYSANVSLICEVSVSSSNGEILITGLTATDSAVLFDETISPDVIIWQCNSSLGSLCTDNEVVTDLIVGATYYLSVENSECDELIPIVVLGAPLECTVELTIEGDTVNLTGLSPDDSAQIFDANFELVWSCNSWSGAGSICQPNQEIDNLISGATYYLSVNSDVCEEWIPFSVGESQSCTANFSIVNNEITLTGLTADMTVGLFDIAGASIFKCKPTGQISCLTTEVIENLNVGETYFLDIQSPSCDESIEILVLGDTDDDDDEYDGDDEEEDDEEENEDDEDGDDDNDDGDDNDPLDCTAELEVVGNEVNLTGLTPDDNTKIFDANFEVVWSCNPWSGSGSICTANPEIDNLVLGSSYYLSVVSDVCEEWIPFNFGQSLGCTADYFVINDGITMTGLTADMSVTLFDNTGTSIFKCKPSGQLSCLNTEVASDLIPGDTYYLSIQSATCDEWIPVTILEAFIPQISGDSNDRFKITALFPNPTVDESILQVESLNNQQVSLEVYDLVGKLQSSKDINLEIGSNNVIVNLKNFKAGIYNVMIIGDGNQFQSSRIVKIRL